MNLLAATTDNEEATNQVYNVALNWLEFEKNSCKNEPTILRSLVAIDKKTYF